MTTIAHKLMTAEEFAALPEPLDGSQQELVKGEVVIMPPPQARHGIICSRIDRRLGIYVEENNLGWTTSNDTGVILERDPDTVRGPDVAFWSIARQPELPAGYFEIPPDTAVEVLSPTNTMRQIDAKLREYFFADVREVWVIDPEYRNITIFREPLEGRLYKEGATFDGGEVLPGFTCPVADLFAQ